jgi:hypothetical protein
MDSEDSENDSDYIPEQDEDNEDVAVTHDKLSTLPRMTTHKKRQIDSIFAEMCEGEQNTIHEKMNKRMHASSVVPSVSKKRKAVAVTASGPKLKDMLSAVFGSSVPNAMPLASSKAKEDSSSKSNALDMKKQIEAAVNSVAKKIVVTETKKFAGQKVSVQKTSMVASNTVTSQTNAAANNSLDKLLVDLKGPVTVSTISKSSADWSSFKVCVCQAPFNFLLTNICIRKKKNWKKI